MEGSTEILTPQPIPVPKLAGNPWNTSPPVQVSSLEEVMSEELAKAMQEEDELHYLKSFDKSTVQKDEFVLPVDADCTDDQMLAQMLQMEFDKEHDEVLMREEKKFNGTNKVSISFENYRTIRKGCLDDDNSSDSDLEEDRNWDKFEEAEKKTPTVGKSGFARHGSGITTKHDLNICGRRNACKVMGFPPGFETGDGGGFDMKLSNSVYNQLKVHSITEEKRNKRLHDKIEKSTAVQALDPKTRLLLYKLVNAGTLDAVNGCISTGKESVVLHGDGGKMEGVEVPSECALKVFKTTLNEFKDRDKYIRDDYRFKGRFNKQNPRQLIHMWAEKEMHNLKRIHNAGIPCPEVITLKKHVLVMSFIGKDHQPAPKLKDVSLTPEKMRQAYLQTVEIMKKLYKECNLVHADLSEYNLLWHNNKVWIIDVSQSVEPVHPHALEFLYRDSYNISTFFSKHLVSDVLSTKELFVEVSGVDLHGEGAEIVSEILDYERNEELLSHGISYKSDTFDYLFEKSLANSQRKSTTVQEVQDEDATSSTSEH